MTVCIVGCKGNMGRRYASVLDYIGEDSFGIDILDGINKYCDTYIIATPTHTHVDIILQIKEQMNKHATILCEKPITTDVKEFERIPKEYWDDVYMVNNYAYESSFEDSRYGGTTSYDFYNSGNDGLAWDCIQLIHLAQKKYKIFLYNKSPIWRVKINGWPIDKEDIDRSYIDMLIDFLGERKKCWSLHKAYEAHLDVMDYLRGRSDGQ